MERTGVIALSSLSEGAEDAAVDKEVLSLRKVESERDGRLSWAESPALLQLGSLSFDHVMGEEEEEELIHLKGKGGGTFSKTVEAIDPTNADLLRGPTLSGADREGVGDGKSGTDIRLPPGTLTSSLHGDHFLNCEEDSVDCISEEFEAQLEALLESSVRHWKRRTATQSPHSLTHSIALGLFIACFFLIFAPPATRHHPIGHRLSSSDSPEEPSTSKGAEASVVRQTKLVSSSASASWNSSETELHGGDSSFSTEEVPKTKRVSSSASAGEPSVSATKSSRGLVSEAIDSRALKRREALAALFPEDLFSAFPNSSEEESERRIPGERFLSSLEFKGVLRWVEATGESREEFQRRILSDARLMTRRLPHVVARIMELPVPGPGGADATSLVFFARFLSLKLRLGDSLASVSWALQQPVGGDAVQEAVFCSLSRFVDEAETVAEATADLEDSWTHLNQVLHLRKKRTGSSFPSSAPSSASERADTSPLLREEDVALAELRSRSSRCKWILARIQQQLEEGAAGIAAASAGRRSSAFVGSSSFVDALRRAASFPFWRRPLPEEEEAELAYEALKALGDLAAARSRFQESLLSIQQARLSPRDLDLGSLVEESKRKHAELDESRLVAKEALRMADLPPMFANLL